MKYFESLVNLLKRDRKEIFFLFQALFYLLLFKYKLYKHDFNYLSKLYKLKQIQHEDIIKDNNSFNVKLIKTIGWAVERASLLLPWDGLCLVKALAAQRILLKNKKIAVIYLGVKKGKKSKDLEAHAWLKYNDIFLTGKAGHNQFTVVSKFTWDINE